MTARTESSFYLYGVGEKPEALTLGSLVLEKYWQPLIARHYTHGLLSSKELQKYAHVSNLTNVTLHGRSLLAPSVSVNGMDIVDLTLAWEKDIERMVVARKGVRMTLKDPEEFLTTSVLTNPAAQQKLKLWLSAARSDYIMRGKFARRPKVWLLTGLYLLEGTHSMTYRSRSGEVSAGISAALVSALSGVPVGGSLSLGKGKQWTVAMESAEKHVWAAQYRLLDARFIKLGKGGMDAVKLPLSMDLHRDILSVNTFRGAGKDGVELELKDDEASEESIVEDPEEWKGYEERLEMAISVFEKAPEHFLR